MTAWLTAVVHGGFVTAADERPVPWWSFSKTVLAAAALALAADGRLALDAPVAGERFTLRQLLQHRAGLGDYGRLAAYHAAVARGDTPWSECEMLGRVGPPLCAPGERFSYSNVGYMHIGRLVAQAAGEDLGTALQRLVLAPSGVTGARVAATTDDLAATAWGNERGYDLGWVYHPMMTGPVGQAALLLDRLLAGAVLPPGLLAEMQTPQSWGHETPGRPWTKAGYGLGLMCGTGQPALHFEGHTGGGPGSRIAVYRARETGLTACAAAAVEDEGAAERCAMALAAGRTAGIAQFAPAEPVSPQGNA